MAEGKESNPVSGKQSALNGILRVTATMLEEYKEQVEFARQLSAESVEEPVDCVALLAVLQAAQALYTEHCPIA